MSEVPDRTDKEKKELHLHLKILRDAITPFAGAASRQALVQFEPLFRLYFKFNEDLTSIMSAISTSDIEQTRKNLEKTSAEFLSSLSELNRKIENDLKKDLKEKEQLKKIDTFFEKSDIENHKRINPLESVKSLTNESLTKFTLAIGRAIVQIEELEKKKPKPAEENKPWFFSRWLKSFRDSIRKIEFKHITLVAALVVAPISKIPLTNWLYNAEQRKNKKIKEATILKESKELYYENELKKLSDKDKFTQLNTPAENNIYVKLFNISPQKAMELLPESYKTAEGKANFLRNTPGLDKKQVGGFLGEENNESILKVYVQSFNFSGKNFTKAFREFLGTFRIPKDIESSDRILDAFAIQFQEQNKTIFTNINVVRRIARASMKLHDTFHNPDSKEKQKTQQEFVVLVTSEIINNEIAKRASVAGRPLDKYEKILKEIYDNIKNKRIEPKDENGGRRSTFRS